MSCNTSVRFTDSEIRVLCTGGAEVVSRRGESESSLVAWHKFQDRTFEFWKQIDGFGSAQLDWLRDEVVRDFHDRLQGLSTGAPGNGDCARRDLRSLVLRDFARVRSLNVTVSEYWSSAGGRRYLAEQRRAITAGTLVVTRIFVLEASAVADSWAIVRDNIEAGVEVLVVLSSEVEAGVDPVSLSDFSVVEDHGGIRALWKPGSGGQPGMFTNSRDRVVQAENILGKVMAYAHPASDFYPELDGST